MAKDLAKTYSPKDFEAQIYDKWEKSGAFKPKGVGVPFTIMMPPPNVTGRLHMGHALNMTLQDIICRYQRMRGRDVLWQAGTDHAGIATQAVVERELAKTNNQTRQELGREAFEKKVWEWKEQSGGAIVEQLKRLGASTDWQSARFTLDEGMSQAVRVAFVKLHEAGLIYRDKRLVNWDVKLKTAISDLEVVPQNVKGHLWHLRYPLEEGGDIVVATTRPETMLGDCAVAVHPDDRRYKNLIGKKVRLPLTTRSIPIIADDYADPAQGSGAVKITPAHDFNDFEVGKRHNLTPINILDRAGALLDSEPIPAAYRGLSREAGRKKIVADLEALGLLEQVEEITHSVPYGDRSNEIIEPYLTWQWFVDAEKLAPAALAAVEKGETKFVPTYWQKTYFEWLNNIQPWCISRQLWWGHRIPAWFDEEGNFYVAMNEAEAQKQAGDKKLSQDEDVLDTWFSSGLWAFSTLGWGAAAQDEDRLARYYPTQLLITGLDIIFFWVARMMMLSCYFMGKAPFNEVYIHALVRDSKGQKMTKSKGNVIDPIELMDKYGADALRFTMAAMAVQGQDLKLSTQRIEGYRNFATKLWNAARFCEMNECVYDKNFEPNEVKSYFNIWIIDQLKGAKQVNKEALKQYAFNHAADNSYHFVWHDFCDWYLEFAKVLLDDKDIKIETQGTLAFVLREILIMLHPFMPFITEELWQDDSLLINAIQTEARLEVVTNRSLPSYWDAGTIIDMVKEIRSIREKLNISAGQIISFKTRSEPEVLTMLKKLARLEIDSKNDLNDVENWFKAYDDRSHIIYLDIKDKINDIPATIKKIEKDMERGNQEIEKIESRMNDRMPKDIRTINQARQNRYVIEGQQQQSQINYLKKISGSK